jgi:hypothetical protein
MGDNRVPNCGFSDSIMAKIVRAADYEGHALIRLESGASIGSTVLFQFIKALMKNASPS